MTLVEISGKLSRTVDRLGFPPPVKFVYNPLIYAWRPHELYLETYGASPKRVLFLGMNPGPFGMAQTGIPFGEIAAVRDWLRVEGKVDPPAAEHPKRPIQGFACSRSEVSGRRLWGLFRKHFENPADFFRDHFVANYCPLVFMSESGANITPDKIERRSADPLFRACDEALAETIRLLKPRFVVGIGKFAEKKIVGLQRHNFSAADFEASSILHPSPASPKANKGWEEEAERQLVALGIW